MAFIRLPPEVSTGILIVGLQERGIAVWIRDHLLGCAVASLQPAPRLGQPTNGGPAPWSRAHERRNSWT
jgi:hypothetical protein